MIKHDIRNAVAQGPKSNRTFAMIELRRIAFEVRDQMVWSQNVHQCVTLMNEFIQHFCLDEERK